MPDLETCFTLSYPPQNVFALAANHQGNTAIADADHIQQRWSIRSMEPGDKVVGLPPLIFKAGNPVTLIGQDRSSVSLHVI